MTSFCVKWWSIIKSDNNALNHVGTVVWYKPYNTAVRGLAFKLRTSQSVGGRNALTIDRGRSVYDSHNHFLSVNMVSTPLSNIRKWICTKVSRKRTSFNYTYSWQQHYICKVSSNGARPQLERAPVLGRAPGSCKHEPPAVMWTHSAPCFCQLTPLSPRRKSWSIKKWHFEPLYTQRQ